MRQTMALRGRIETLLWYAERPSYLPNLVHIMKGRLSGKIRGQTAAESLAWCKANAVSSAEALRRLFPHRELTDIEKIFPEDMAFAKAAEAACPTKMGGPGAIDLIYSVCEALGAKRAIETGVAYGWSSLALLLSLSKDGPHRLISIDMPYPKLNNEPYVGCVVPERMRSSWTIVREPDVTGLNKALAALPQIDVCHYDSDKSYSGRMFAYPKLWGALRPGGVLISDDIDDNTGFRDFCTRIQAAPTVVEYQGKYVGLLRK
jgi:predicted O-methyltransferase YrrM